MGATALSLGDHSVMEEDRIPLWKAMDKRWKMNVVSLVSSVMVVMRLSIAYVSSLAMSCHVSAVFTANG